uniref:ShKT domain-containing protein n=1 Tax=Syphacia muris TaxID=451379 RepID=A0A0N5ADS3_9BILA
MLLILFSLLVTSFGQHFDGSNHCVDLSSNCVKRQSLCQNALFEDLMREQCRKTCNFCDDDPDGAPIDATDEDTFIEEQSVEETTPGSFEEIDSAVEEPEVGPEPEPIEYSTRAPAYSKKIDACLDRSHDCA